MKFGWIVIAVAILAAPSVSADQFYFRTEDGLTTYGPFEYKSGVEAIVGETAYILATSSRAVGDRTINEIYLRSVAGNKAFGPFPLVDETVVKLGEDSLEIITSPFTRWKTRKAVSLEMWQWELAEGNSTRIRSRSYNKLQGKWYVIVTARLKADGAYDAASGWFSQIHFETLFKQLFSINPTDDELTAKLAETRFGDGGPKAFMAAIVPKQGYSSCFFAFSVPTNAAMDKLVFDGEIYLLPEADKRTYDQIKIGEEIWKIVPNRMHKGAINPDQAGEIIAAPKEKEDAEPVSNAPEVLEPMGDQAAHEKALANPPMSQGQSDIEARKAAIRNRMSRRLERSNRSK